MQKTPTRALRLFLVCVVLALALGALAGCQGMPGGLDPAATPTAATGDLLSPAQLQAMAAALASAEPPPLNVPNMPLATDAPAATGAGSTVASPGTPEAPGTPEPGATPEPVSLTPAPTPQSIGRTQNFLILGTDTRDTMRAWRTDSIIIVAVDEAAGQVGLISVPRDLFVSIPGYGQERINAVDYIGEKGGYPGGGPGLLSRVVQQTLGIPIRHWVRIKQDGLIKLVDALGGVVVQLDCPLYELTPDKNSPTGYTQFVLPAGAVALDGPAAKKFVTYRYMSSNFGRERRQQQLIWAIRNRALKGDVLPRIPELWAALQDVFTTDLGLTDVVRLASLGARLQGKNIHAMSFTPDLVRNYTTSGGAEVLMLNSPAALRARLARLFSAPPVSDVNKAPAGGCPPAPRGFPNLSPRPTASPAAAAN